MLLTGGAAVVGFPSKILSSDCVVPVIGVAKSGLWVVVVVVVSVPSKPLSKSISDWPFAPLIVADATITNRINCKKNGFCLVLLLKFNF